MHFEIYPVKPTGLLAIAQGATQQWRWRLQAGNNRIISSGESFTSQQACRDSINLVMQTTIFTPVQIVAA